MSRKSESSEKTKKIILAVLLLVMVAVAAYQLFLSEPTPKKRPQPTAAPGPARAAIVRKRKSRPPRGGLFMRFDDTVATFRPPGASIGVSREARHVTATSKPVAGVFQGRRIAVGQATILTRTGPAGSRAFSFVSHAEPGPGTDPEFSWPWAA